jgi:hypothetical protein
VSPTTPSLATPHHTRPTPGLLPSWAPLPAPLRGLPGNDLQDPTSWDAPPLCTLKRLHGDSCSSTTAPSSLQWHSPQPSAGGGAATNAGAHPQPHAGSQDNCNCKLLLPQLNSLHLAFKRSQVSPSVSSSSQAQQAQQPPKSVIPTQRRVTEQLTMNCAPFKALRQHYTGTRFEEQRQLHLPQKHKATVADSTLRVEMNALPRQPLRRVSRPIESELDVSKFSN